MNANTHTVLSWVGSRHALHPWKHCLVSCHPDLGQSLAGGQNVLGLFLRLLVDIVAFTRLDLSGPNSVHGLKHESI